MKKILSKMIPVIGIVLFSTSFLSCSSGSDDDDLAINTVSVPVDISCFSSFTSDAHGEIVFNKLKELQFIESYSSAIGYIAFPVNFEQKSVKSSDMEKVLATLTAQAHSHYAVALDKVNKFDFNSLIIDELAAGHASVDITIGESVYAAKVVVQKPLIWDKVWNTTITDCPIQKMSFEQNAEDVIGQLHLQNGSIVQTTKVQRSSSTQIVVVTADYSYVFKILSATQMQLVRFKATGQSLIDVTDLNYLFNPES